MVQELLGGSDASVQILRAGFMLLLALVQVAAIRPFVQVNAPDCSSQCNPWI